MVVNQFSVELLANVARLAKIPQTSVSLNQMVLFTHSPSTYSLYKGARFLHLELQIRLAHRVIELDTLPHNLSLMPSILTVKQWYTQSCKELIDFKHSTTTTIPDSLQVLEQNCYFHHPSKLLHHSSDCIKRFETEMREYNKQFINVLARIKQRHSPTTTTIATGVLELKEEWIKSSKTVQLVDKQIQTFLDNFYMSRIGIRMLIGQHIALSSPTNPPDYVGIICTKTALAEVIEDAIANAQSISQDFYALYEPVSVQVIGIDSIKGEFMYVASHLHHMLFELLKNSMRAVIETTEPDTPFPAIRVVIAQGAEDITIKVSDEGGGIPRSGMPLIWTYLYTTAPQPLHPSTIERSNDFRAPIAGRLYARYFGGDLRVISMESYGTDAYLHLSRLHNSTEPLT